MPRKSDIGFRGIAFFTLIGFGGQSRRLLILVRVMPYLYSEYKNKRFLRILKSRFGGNASCVRF